MLVLMKADFLKMLYLYWRNGKSTDEDVKEILEEEQENIVQKNSMEYFFYLMK